MKLYCRNAAYLEIGAVLVKIIFFVYKLQTMNWNS